MPIGILSLTQANAKIGDNVKLVAKIKTASPLVFLTAKTYPFGISAGSPSQEFVVPGDPAKVGVVEVPIFEGIADEYDSAYYMIGGKNEAGESIAFGYCARLNLTA